MKFSLIALALIPAAFAAPAIDGPEQAKIDTSLKIVTTLTNDLLVQIDQLAKMKGLTLEDVVQFPSDFDSSNLHHLQKRDKDFWTDFGYKLLASLNAAVDAIIRMHIG